MLRLNKPERAFKLLNKVNKSHIGTNIQSRRYLMAKWYDMVANKLKFAKKPDAAKDCSEQASMLRKIYAGHKIAAGPLGQIGT